MSHDLRLAVRSLGRAPGLAAAAIVTLALGIGATTTMFSLLDAVMLKPLPVTKPGELSVLHLDAPGAEPDLSAGGGQWMRFPYPVVQAIERALPAGASLAAMTRVTPYDVQREDGGVVPATVQLVSGNYFRTFDVQPALGRLISEGDNRVINGHPVAVVSERFWQRSLDGDPAVVGRALRINDLTVTIIGVTRGPFVGTSSDTPAAIWLPLVMQHVVHYASNSSGYGPAEIEQQPWAPQDAISWLNVVFRAPGGAATIAAAVDAAYTNELRRIIPNVQSADVRARLQRETVALAPFGSGFSGLRQQYSTALRALLAFVALVLLLACANIANLLLVRGAARERETRIRVALGATRAQVFVGQLAESIVLAAAGAAGAILLATAVGPAIASRVLGISTDALPTVFSLDLRVLGFALLVALLSVVLFGLAPAWSVTRRVALAETARTPASAAATTGMRPLITVQVALALLLVTMAAWFGRSLYNVWRLEPGFATDRVVTLTINPRNSGYEPTDLPALYDRLVLATLSVPGVQSASVAACGVAVGCRSINRFRIQGFDDGTPDGLELRSNRIGSGYFATLGIPLLEGREFGSGDIEGAPGVAIVTRSLVTRYFGGESPIGKRIGYNPPGREIVGVVDDARVADAREDPVPMVYTPIAQSADYANSLAVRVQDAPGVVAPLLRQAIVRGEPRLAVLSALPLDERVERTRTRETLVMWLTGGFAALALFLAAFGLYGVLAYVVARRTAELGVRMALGATPGDLRRMVLVDGGRVVGAGLLLGVLAATAVGPRLSPLLFRVTPGDLPTYAVVTLTLVVAALLACYVPARRASRVDPVIAIRSE